MTCRGCGARPCVNQPHAEECRPVTDLTKPLADVPVGAHIVHGDAWTVISHKAGLVKISRRDRPALWLSSSTRVLHLDGNAPRPLAQCVGRDVWVPHGLVIRAGAPGRPHLDQGQRVWPILPPQPAADQPQSREQISRYYTSRVAANPDHAAAWADPDATSPLSLREVSRELGLPPLPDERWEVVDNRLFFAAALDFDVEVHGDEGDREPLARALADHLNATGWQPPAPEPERPTLQDAADWLTDLMVKDDHEDTLRWLLVDHAVGRGGTVNVDVQALSEAVQWLRGFFPTYAIPDDEDMTPARALLDALGVDR